MMQRTEGRTPVTRTHSKVFGSDRDFHISISLRYPMRTEGIFRNEALLHGHYVNDPLSISRCGSLSPLNETNSSETHRNVVRAARHATFITSTGWVSLAGADCWGTQENINQQSTMNAGNSFPNESIRFLQKRDAEQLDGSKKTRLQESWERFSKASDLQQACGVLQDRVMATPRWEELIFNRKASFLHHVTWLVD